MQGITTGTARLGMQGITTGTARLRIGRIVTAGGPQGLARPYGACLVSLLFDASSCSPSPRRLVLFRPCLLEALTRPCRASRLSGDSDTAQLEPNSHASPSQPCASPVLRALMRGTDTPPHWRQRATSRTH